MKILAVDVGTGTQDILLFDSDKEVENCYKLVLPSPTVMLAEQIRAATRRGQGVLLSGVLMGGGPCAWAARDHAQAGYPLWVTPNAARTFDDDPQRVEAMGATIIDEAEAVHLKGEVARLTMGDFDYPAIAAVFARFGVALNRELAAVAVAVFALALRLAGCWSLITLSRLALSSRLLPASVSVVTLAGIRCRFARPRLRHVVRHGFLRNAIAEQSLDALQQRPLVAVDE